jgi:hypothetical protein
MRLLLAAGALAGARLAAAAPHNAAAHAALAAAVRNATSDLDEFVAILSDWLDGRGEGDRGELLAFLARVAVR